MASSTLKPGVPVTLQELEPSSEMFKQGASLRVTGMYVQCYIMLFFLLLNIIASLNSVNVLSLQLFSLHSYDVDSAVAVIQDGSAKLKVDTQHLRDISFRCSSTYQFIGELLIQPNSDVIISPSPAFFNQSVLYHWNDAISIYLEQAILQARVGRNVDGLDLNLYQQSLFIRRQHEAKLLSSRRA
jgi:hypothetical protein